MPWVLRVWGKLCRCGNSIYSSNNCNDWPGRWGMRSLENSWENCCARVLWVPELVDNHITTHDIPRNSSVPCQRAWRSVTVVVCSTVTRFCFLWGVVFESGAQASAPQILIITGPHGKTRADATEEFKESVSRVYVHTHCSHQA